MVALTSCYGVAGPSQEAFRCGMAWVKPMYPRPVVNKAARCVIDPESPPEEFDGSLTVVNNWRAAHAFPLNTFQIGLRRRTANVDKNGIIAQRIKRLPAIELKLKMLPDLRFSQMQ